MNTTEAIRAAGGIHTRIGYAENAIVFDDVAQLLAFVELVRPMVGEGAKLSRGEVRKLPVEDQLRHQIANLERINANLNDRLFGALKTDPILAEGLHEVDHAMDLSRGVFHRVLDVACVAVARVKELEALAATPQAVQQKEQP
jgi:hypothetical protein